MGFLRGGKGAAVAASSFLLWACSTDEGAATPEDTESGGSDASSDTGASSGPAADESTGSGGSPSSTSGASAEDSGSSTGEPEPRPYPEPGDRPPNSGPGGPQVVFEADELYTNCAYLTGGESDFDHHNLVVMFDGYLLMPWAPEQGSGGFTFFDISDPCSPEVVGRGFSQELRESHSLGFAHLNERWWLVANQKRPGLLEGRGGIQFWDITDPSQPLPMSKLEIEGHFYPDAYARVVLSVFWQAPYVYVAAADNGLYIVDATNPLEPELVRKYDFEPTLRAGQVQVVGNLLVVSAAEGPRTVLLDVSDPVAPQPIAGGDFEIVDGEGATREGYFSNLGAGHVWYAVKNGDGGLLAYDIRDPSNPTYAGHLDSGGNGGYVFIKDDLAFVGESNFAGIYDVADPSAIEQVATLELTGDLDTVTPIGNVAVLAVDDEAEPDQATAIAPYLTEVDTTAPRVTWAVPSDGAEGLPVTSRIGLVFNEMVDVKSAWEGSVRLWETGTDPALTRVDGHVSVQESVVNFSPLEPLKPGTQYTLSVPAGGIVDYNANAVTEDFELTFTTAGG